MSADDLAAGLAARFDYKDARELSDERLELVDAALTELGLHAVPILKRDLARYGNSITGSHAKALAAILERYGSLAARLSTGRWVFDLDTGMGKTTSVIAWIAAVLELRFPFSIAVAASQVESLCDIKRALVAKGIDGGRIGLQHSKHFNADKADAARRRDPAVSKDYASLPRTDDNHLRQVVLVTHEKLRSGRKLDLLMSYRGQDRDLVIWDESLLVSNCRSIPLLRAEKALGWLQPQVFNAANRNPERALQEEAFEHVEQCVLALRAELTAQQAEHRAPQPLEFEPLTAPQLADYRRILRSAFASPDAPRKDGKALRELLAMSGGPVRALRAGHEDAAVQYELAVPDELERVVILDASFPVRVLERLDPSLKHDPGFDGRVKRYSNVTVHYWQRPAGRGAVEREFRERHADDRVLSREIVEVVKRIPDDEALLIFTFKPRTGTDGSGGCIEVLRDDLRRGGVDPDATLADGRVRVVFLTWGRETSLNEYSYVRHVIFAGVLHRAHHDLAAAIVGQRRDLLSDLPAQELHDVRLSEVAHGIYQALSRGCCRIVEGNEARRMDVWLPNNDPRVVEHLRALMPGVRVEGWELVYAHDDRRAQQQAVEVLVAYLRGLSEDLERLTVPRVKRECGLTALRGKTWQRVRDRALEALRRERPLGPYFEVQGGSLVRVRPDF